jgi:glucose/arabinose dehydrogenase
MRRKWILVGLLSSLALAAGLLFATLQEAAAGPVQTWPEISFNLVESGFDAPIQLTHAGDNSGRLFVVEQPGRIRIIEDNQVTGIFLDISGRVRSPASGGGNEEGLLSVAFPPGYAAKGYFYVYYTNLNGNNQVSRFHLGQGPDAAEPDSEELILPLSHPTYGNHNGGQLAFGPDGYLYIATGDGGGGGDPEENAQNTASLLGKLLRIDVEPEEPAPSPTVTPPASYAHQVLFPLIFDLGNPFEPVQPAYTIPPDNPFAGQQGTREEVWALGLRNPWRFSFDRQTGDLYLGDVGQGSWEEVNFQPASSQGGENYGWNIMEGQVCYNSPSCNTSGLTLPVSVYPTHSSGSCSVTGGFVYRGSDYPGMQGIYFFADFCNGKIWGLQREGDAWVRQELADTDYMITGFGEDQGGELYLVDRGGGVYQVVEGDR